MMKKYIFADLDIYIIKFLGKNVNKLYFVVSTALLGTS